MHQTKILFYLCLVATVGIESREGCCCFSLPKKQFETSSLLLLRNSARAEHGPVSWWWDDPFQSNIAVHPTARLWLGLDDVMCCGACSVSGSVRALLLILRAPGHVLDRDLSVHAPHTTDHLLKLKVTQLSVSENIWHGDDQRDDDVPDHGLLGVSTLSVRPGSTAESRSSQITPEMLHLQIQRRERWLSGSVCSSWASWRSWQKAECQHSCGRDSMQYRMVQQGKYLKNKSFVVTLSYQMRWHLWALFLLD